MALAVAVKSEAERLGFDAVAIGPATPAAHGAAFERWLDDGCAGTMEYLERTRSERLDPARLLPSARAVVAVALSYGPSASESSEDDGPASGGMRLARSRGRSDYH